MPVPARHLHLRPGGRHPPALTRPPGKQYAVSPRPLTKVLAAVEGAWGGVAAPTAEARARAERAVREFRGSESLWEAGLHPEHVLEFAALAPGIDEPLPEAFFLGVAYSGVDVDLARHHRGQPS